MDFTFAQKRFKKLLAQKDIYLKILIGALVMNILQMVERMMHHDKVILVPPTLSQDVWVMGGITSKSFIEEWALYLSSTLLNVTPQTAAYHHKIVLRYVHPLSVGNIQKKLKKDLQHLSENNMSTLFKPKSVLVTQEGQKGRALIQGTLSTFVGSKCIEDVEKTYVMTFETSKQTPQIALSSFTLQENEHIAEEEENDTPQEQEETKTGE